MNAILEYFDLQSNQRNRQNGANEIGPTTMARERSDAYRSRRRNWPPSGRNILRLF